MADLVYLALTVWFFLFGFMRGFLRSIFGPIGMILGSWIAISYYQTTHNIVISLLIGLFGPSLISLGLNLATRSLFNSGDKEEINVFSRLAGAFLTLIWGWFFIILASIMLDVLPMKNQTLNNMQKSMRSSMTYQNAILPIKNIIIPPPKNSAQAIDVKESAAELAQDPRFKAVWDDPVIKQAAENKDYKTLLSNPKIMQLTQDIANDPVLLKKVLSFYAQMQQQQK